MGGLFLQSADLLPKLSQQLGLGFEHSIFATRQNVAIVNQKHPQSSHFNRR